MSSPGPCPGVFDDFDQPPNAGLASFRAQLRTEDRTADEVKLYEFIENPLHDWDLVIGTYNYDFMRE